jgi:hypothetical protein
MDDLIIKWKNDALNIMIANVTESTTDKQTQRNLFIAQLPQKAKEISKTVITHFFPHIPEHESILTYFYIAVCKELVDRMTLYSNYRTNTEMEARSIEKLKILRQDHSQKQVMHSAAQIVANNQSSEGKNVVGAIINNSINNNPIIKKLKKDIVRANSKHVKFSPQSKKSYDSVSSSSQPRDKNSDKNNNKNKKRKREKQPLQSHRQSQSQSQRHTQGQSQSQSQSQSPKNSMAQVTRFNPSKPTPSSNKKQKTENVKKTSTSSKR